jgi:hypothetical protein
VAGCWFWPSSRWLWQHSPGSSPTPARDRPSSTPFLAAASTGAGGAIAGHGTSYAGLGGALAGAYLTTALNVVMGALFEDNADRLDVFVTFGPIAERQLHGTAPETLTAVGVWIVLPTIIGLWESSRREVK